MQIRDPKLWRMSQITQSVSGKGEENAVPCLQTPSPKFFALNHVTISHIMLSAS